VLEGGPVDRLGDDGERLDVVPRRLEIAVLDLAELVPGGTGKPA
jgi:hypothetical protein